MKDRIDQMLLPFCTENGITLSQACLLTELYLFGPQRAGALAKRACIAEANSSVLCKRLAAQGLIARQRDPNDERHVLISLLPEGTHLAERFAAQYSNCIKDLSLHLTRADVQVITDGMERLLAAADAAQAPADTAEKKEIAI